MDKELAGQVADIAQRVVASGPSPRTGMAAALQRAMAFEDRGTVHA
jgi:hypothetical protein